MVRKRTMTARSRATNGTPKTLAGACGVRHGLARTQPMYLLVFRFAVQTRAPFWHGLGRGRSDALIRC